MAQLMSVQKSGASVGKYNNHFSLLRLKKSLSSFLGKSFTSFRGRINPKISAKAEDFIGKKNSRNETHFKRFISQFKAQVRAYRDKNDGSSLHQFFDRLNSTSSLERFVLTLDDLSLLSDPNAYQSFFNQCISDTGFEGAASEIEFYGACADVLRPENSGGAGDEECYFRSPSPSFSSSGGGGGMMYGGENPYFSDGYISSSPFCMDEGFSEPEIFSHFDIPDFEVAEPSPISKPQPTPKSSKVTSPVPPKISIPEITITEAPATPAGDSGSTPVATPQTQTNFTTPNKPAPQPVAAQAIDIGSPIPFPRTIDAAPVTTPAKSPSAKRSPQVLGSPLKPAQNSHDFVGAGCTVKCNGPSQTGPINPPRDLRNFCDRILNDYFPTSHKNDLKQGVLNFSNRENLVTEFSKLLKAFKSFLKPGENVFSRSLNGERHGTPHKNAGLNPVRANGWTVESFISGLGLFSEDEVGCISSGNLDSIKDILHRDIDSKSHEKNLRWKGLFNTLANLESLGSR